jgi:hypothetical protein
VLASLASAPPVVAQAAPFCQPGQAPHFVFGFGLLKQVIGADMGEPTECEHPNAANGDTLQHTTTGLAFYRKSTNTPTFTDGWRHWALVADGILLWTGPDIDPPGIALSPPLACHDIGDGHCLRADSSLAEPIRLLSTTSAGRPLLRNAALAGVNARVEDMPSRVLGNFDPNTGELVLNSRLSSYPAIDRAPVLAHELQHATDWIMFGVSVDTSRGCFTTEANAFRVEAQVWIDLQGGRLKPPTNDVERELNAIADAIRTNPNGFLNSLTTVYRHQCSPG